MKQALQRAFALKPIAKAAARLSSPALSPQANTYAARVAAHTAALVALMEATSAVRLAVGVKTPEAVAEHAASLDYIKQLASAGTKAVPANPYWSQRNASARTADVPAGQSIHHRVLSRTGGK
jgi:hypothetical protein